MTQPTRLLIADDHPAIRAGLRTLLSSCDDLDVVGEAADGLEAVALWRETRPHIGLFDLGMPGLDGVGALQGVREHDPLATIIILTALATDADIDRAIGAGANAYLHKDAELSEIVDCIRSVRLGAPRVHASVQSRLSSRIGEDPLTRREVDVLHAIARGWSNRRVAAELRIGESTVKTHLKRVFGKLRSANRTEAVVVARRKGLLS